MIKRMLFVIVYIICFPLVYIAIGITFIIMPIALIKYIVSGENQMDFIISPVKIAVTLPFKIMGE